MTKKQRVLIVDDEQRNQRIVTEILEDLVDFKLAGTGEEALEIANEYDPDLILLDIMMPGMDGYDVCKKIRENPKFKLTKIILVSGKAMLEERLKGYAVGADDYMTKPFVPEELLAKAKVFLRLVLAERELSELNHSLDLQVQERTRQLMEAEARLVNTAKMSALGEMAGGIAHEINTPLGTISLLADQMVELVAEPELDRPMLTKLANRTGETVRRISLIIQGLRTFSRDGSRDRFDAFPIKKIMDDTLGLCREKFKYSNIELRVDPIPETFRAQCQAVQISQVLLNLLGNACDAVKDNPEKWVQVSVEDKGEAFEIYVTDSGTGIPEQTLQKIFQPFFTTKEIGKGTGLGLSISKGIMEAHKGSLSVDSTCKNTRFVVRLPKEQDAGKKAA